MYVYICMYIYIYIYMPVINVWILKGRLEGAGKVPGVSALSGS